MHVTWELSTHLITPDGSGSFPAPGQAACRSGGSAAVGRRGNAWWLAEGEHRSGGRLNTGLQDLAMENFKLGPKTKI